MIRLFVALVCVSSSLALAQEIGTEIQPVTPKSGGATPPPQTPPPAQPAAQTPPPQYDNPYGNAPPASKTETPAPAPVAKPDDGSIKSAGAFSFGFHGSLGGTASVTAPSVTVSKSTAVISPLAPTLGISFFVADSIALTLDFGMGVGITNAGAAVGFGSALGLEVQLRGPTAALRPLIIAQFGFSKAISAADNDFFLVGNLGAGAAYYFSPHFSVDLKALVSIPVALQTGFVSIVTVTPGAGVSLYF